MKATKKTDSRLRPETMDYSEAVFAKMVSRGNHMSAKVKTCGKLTEYDICDGIDVDPQVIALVLGKIAEKVGEGYEVQLCESVRFYQCLEKFKTPFICAASMGDFRKAVAGKTVCLTRKCKPITPEKAVKVNEDLRKAKMVTPDTMVTCPKCGTEFRVGKKIG